ncbi:hypothetical protein [Streptomyces radicis]|uniref:Uncharacterized protein n=1 Tax=Streptomyces radicis TaxID=1750517 RepID=A0A3A9W2E9_9ACTN|nr:hypothetical protein [Streptomyces radicis]RKN07415.1 hypothetical protein D7319_18875 [Streptomyces radicis]RKN19566.1 hypothetical protein D7318_19650 [Streptomyces radicis]
MRSYAGVLVGKLIFCAICLCPAPIALVVGFAAWRDGEDWAWIALLIGLVGSVLIVVVALRATRNEVPRISRGDLLRDTDVSYGDDTFVLWAPRSPAGSARARLARADVLEASLVRYSPEGEATFTTYGGDHAPDEFTPLIRLRLRVHGSEEAEDAEGSDAFEVTGECRVPSVCLSAVTAGRLAVLVEPAGPGADRKVVPLWPRSALLAGTRTCRVIDIEGRTTEVTGRPGRLLRQMRIFRSAGGVEMIGDTIDLRRLDADTAARCTALAERYRAHPEDRAPVTEPGEEARWIVDQLPGEPGAFGSVGRRWSRRGGVLVRARFLKMAATHTFQDHGPVLDTVLRVRPADGTPPFDAARRLTVPMDYLAVLHRTREVVLSVSPNGRWYTIDWARTNLLAGTTAAKVIAPDGQEFPLTGRPEVIWALMNLLASHALANPTPVLDLRKPRMNAVAGTSMDVVRPLSDPPYRVR